jgi:hypothetical protein
MALAPPQTKRDSRNRKSPPPQRTAEGMIEELTGFSNLKVKPVDYPL